MEKVSPREDMMLLSSHKHSKDIFAKKMKIFFASFFIFNG